MDEVRWCTILVAETRWVSALHMCWTHLNVSILRCEEGETNLPRKSEVTLFLIHVLKMMRLKLTYCFCQIGQKLTVPSS